MAVDALDEAGALTFGPKEFFWEVSIHHKRTSATFYARPTRINPLARSVSGVTHTEIAKIAILEMADLVAVQP